MYECPNCGGNLKFDIAGQQMYCEYCGTRADPYSLRKERDAEERTAEGAGEYETTVFTCPQCGGELISEDATAATFCSFCGSPAILSSRISREKRPKYIIPFTITKEDCRAAYGKMLRKAVFAPKELKDEALIEKFRGIYMPYWIYSFEKKGPITFSGRKSRRRGDYVITDHYRLSCEVEEAYGGLAYDASSSFSDSLSSAIAPFDLRQGKAFTPAFLSGFYADTGDVDKCVYRSEAEDMAVGDAYARLARDPVCRKYHAAEGGDGRILRNVLRPSGSTAESAMLPVWFLSYRNGDRVSYAVVNGRTGKAAADLPVDGKRYIIGSLLLAVPLFFLLNLFLTLTPGKLLAVAALLAFLCILISNAQITRIMLRESGEDDRGLSSVKSLKKAGWGEQEVKKSERKRNSELRRMKIRVFLNGSMGKALLMVFLFFGTGLLPVFLNRILRDLMSGRRGGGSIALYGTVLVPVILGCVWVFFALSGGRRRKKPFGGGHFREKSSVLIKPLGGIVLAVVILIANPVSDLVYYLGGFACLGTVFWAITDIIKQHNMLTTRRPPQLNRRGGDE